MDLRLLKSFIRYRKVMINYYLMKHLLRLINCKDVYYCNNLYLICRLTLSANYVLLLFNKVSREVGKQKVIVVNKLITSITTLIICMKTISYVGRTSDSLKRHIPIVIHSPISQAQIADG